LVNNAANNPKVEDSSEVNFSRLENFPLKIWNDDVAVGLSLFGMPNTIKAIESKNKKLDIGADDTIMALCGYSKDGYNFPLSLVLSYSQVFETRNFRIQCENGFIDCDWNNGKISVVDRNKSEIPEIFESNMSRNEIFIAQTKGFIDAIRCKDTSIMNIGNSINVLKFIENVKKGMV